jgi:hypothetical protein
MQGDISQRPRRASPQKTGMGYKADLGTQPGWAPAFVCCSVRPTILPQNVGTFKTLDPPISHTVHTAAFTRKLKCARRHQRVKMLEPVTSIHEVREDGTRHSTPLLVQNLRRKQDRGLEAIWDFGTSVEGRGRDPAFRGMITIDSVSRNLVSPSPLDLPNSGKRERRGPMRQQVHCLCNLNSGSLPSLSVTPIFPLGQAAMPNKDPFESEPPTCLSPSSDN